MFIVTSKHKLLWESVSIMISSLTWLQSHHPFCFRRRQHFVALHTRYLYWLLLDGKSVTMFSFEGDFRRTPKVSLGGASRKVSFPFDMHHYIWHLSTMIITWKLTILYICEYLFANSRLVQMISTYGQHESDNCCTMLILDLFCYV